MTTEKTKKKSPSGLTKKDVAKLEATIKKLADSVEGSIGLISKVAERVEGLEDKVSEARKLPMIESPEARLEAMKKVTKDGDIGESQRVHDFLNPRGQDGGFQPNDIVKLSESSEPVAYGAYRVDDRGEPDKEGEQAMGVVLSYMYTRRDGQRKYKVNFPPFGKSGFLEKELVLVKAA